mmetsp:Transcript_130079/g.277870  ORF Transcript_130079/g.277870 Transcript_130079/m.277870 type:complete len:226 (+) Transcript_130079:1554-2231(+)
MVLHPRHALRSARWVVRSPGGAHRGGGHGRAHARHQPRGASLDSRWPMVRLGVRPHHLEALRAHHSAARPLRLGQGLGATGPAGAVGLGYVRLPPGVGHVVGRGRGPVPVGGRGGPWREHLELRHSRIRPGGAPGQRRDRCEARLVGQRRPPPPPGASGLQRGPSPGACSRALARSAGAGSPGLRRRPRSRRCARRQRPRCRRAGGGGDRTRGGRGSDLGAGRPL